MRDRPIDLIVAEGLAASGAIASLRTATDGPTPVLVIAPAHDVEARIAFLEAGADDVIAGGFARHRADRPRDGAPHPDGGGRPTSATPAIGEIVAFFSPKGGVGTTTLAVNTAVLLAGGPGEEAPASRRTGCCLARPADRPRPPVRQVATHLNLTPRFDLAGLAGDEPSLADPDLARTFLTTHSSGLNVLAAPARARGRLPGDPRARPAHHRADAAVVRPHPRRPRQPPRPSQPVAPRAVRRARVRPVPGDRRAPRDEPAAGLPGRDHALQARKHLVVNHVFPKELLKTRDVENLLRAKPAAEIPTPRST